MKPEAEDAGLTFDWPRRESFPFILFGCVLVSLVAHLATFFLFQVIYPQRITIPPPPPHLELLTASSPENEALLRWIDAEDPALVASAHAVLPPRFLEVEYQPSYAIARTPPRGSVETPAVIDFPPARDPLAIVQSVNPPVAPATRAAVPTPTGVTFTGALRERPLTGPATFTWTQRVPDAAEPLRAWLGVSDRGEVRYVLLQTSSGQSPLDADVLAQLPRLTFAASDAPIAWGLAVVTFGADAYGVENPNPAVRDPKSR